MNLIISPKITVLSIAFFLIFGLPIGEPNYKNLYQEQLEQTEQLEQRLENLEQQYNVQVQQTKTTEEQLNQAQTNIHQLKGENDLLLANEARLQEEVKYLKRLIEDDLSNDEREKALDEREKGLDNREEKINQLFNENKSYLDERENKLNDRENVLNNKTESLANEQRKIGEIKGKLDEVVKREDERKEEVNRLRKEESQQENSKEFWKNIVLFGSPAIIVFMIILSVPYLIWSQKRLTVLKQELSFYQQSPKPVTQTEDSNQQLNSHNEKNLPKSKKSA